MTVGVGSPFRHSIGSRVAAVVDRRTPSGGGGGVSPVAPDGLPWEHLWWVGGTEFAAQGYADTDNVPTWPDEAGTDDFVSISGAQDPQYVAASVMNGAPAIFLEGTEALRDSWTSIPQPFSIVMIAQAVGASGYFCDGFTSSPRILIIRQAEWQMFAGSTVNSGVSSDASRHLHSAYFNGSSSVLEVDGVPGSTINPGTGACAGLILNSRYNGGNNLGYHLAMMGIYSGDARSDPDWAGFEQWVKDTYDIAVAGTT